MTRGLALAGAAESFLGCAFRANGRVPEIGLDCIGLLQAAFEQAGIPARLPVGYRLRTGDWSGLDDWAGKLGFVVAEGLLQPGDVCLFRPSPMQMHFAIAGTDGLSFVEAHAGLRRVVLTPSPYPHPAVRRWRLAPDT